MKTLRQLVESSEKKVVMAFGRMNPPTAGHAKLVDKVKEVAKHEGADHSIRLSHSQDSKKNPLTADQKIKHAKALFPHTNLSTSSKESPSYLTHAAELHKKGYKHLVMVAGEDRVKQYHDTLHQYNGKFDEHGNGFHFKSIKVVSAGHRDPDAEGTEGISASKMREHARTGNFKEFHGGLPAGTSHAHAKALFHDVQHGMKLHEDADRDAYIRGEIFRQGDLVEDLTTGEICPIEFGGDNYVTILTSTGDVVKRFLYDVMVEEKDTVMADKKSLTQITQELGEDRYTDAWAKRKAQANREAGRVPEKPQSQRSLMAKWKAPKPEKVDHATMARHIETAWGNAFPDGDPYDHLAAKYPHLHREGTLFKHLNTATRKHLGARSFSHYLAQGWDDYHKDQGHHPDSLTYGQKNPWKESVDADDEGLTEEQLVEGLPRAAVKLLRKSDSIDKSPEASHPWKVAASHILQGDFVGLSNHLRSGGRPIASHVMQALDQYGGEEGKNMAKKLGWMGEETELVEWKVGDIVKPTTGPHAHAPHTIIHKHEDGSYNIKPNLPTKMVKYKLGAARARPDQLEKYHTEEVETDTNTLDEKHMTDEQKATRERIVKGMKKRLGDFTKRYGKKAKSVMYATATKQAVGEEKTDGNYMLINVETKDQRWVDTLEEVQALVDEGFEVFESMSKAKAKELSDYMAVTRAGSDAMKGVKKGGNTIASAQKQAQGDSYSKMRASGAWDKKLKKPEKMVEEPQKELYQVFELELSTGVREVSIPFAKADQFEEALNNASTDAEINTLIDTYTK